MTIQQEQTMRERHRAIGRLFDELEAILVVSITSGIGGLVWLGGMLLGWWGGR